MTSLAMRVRARPMLLFGAAVAITAFLVRLVPVLTGGGLNSVGRYDDGVYYAGAEALTFGRLPYRDFVLLHPPGLMLVLTPFTLLGRLTTDSTGMAAGRLAFMAIGALNAVLVAMLARRWGRVAAVIAGGLYACWIPAVYGEQTILLEPIATTAIVTALLLLFQSDHSERSRRREVLAGVALGIAIVFKIWYVAPLLVVLLWLLLSHRLRSLARVSAASAITATTVLAPFFALAPRQMFRMIVLDQLNRPSHSIPLWVRLPQILGVRPLDTGSSAEVSLVTAAALAVVMTATLVCLLDRSTRVIAVMLIVDLLILLVAPAFFLHYAELTAAPAAVVVGISVGKLRAALRPQWLARAMVAAVGVATLASGVDIVVASQGSAAPSASFAAAAPTGCVMSDDPTVLIEMNRLTADFRQGCEVPVDVSGVTYSELASVGPTGQRLRRGHNPAWQQYLHDYLLSGSAFVVIRPKADVIAAPYAGMIRQRPVLARSGSLVLRSGLGTGPVDVDGVEAARATPND